MDQTTEQKNEKLIWREDIMPTVRENGFEGELYTGREYKGSDTAIIGMNREIDEQTEM